MKMEIYENLEWLLLVYLDNFGSQSLLHGQVMDMQGIEELHAQSKS